MKRFTVVSIIFTLVISLTVPSGVVVATELGVGEVDELSQGSPEEFTEPGSDTLDDSQNENQDGLLVSTIADTDTALGLETIEGSRVGVDIEPVSEPSYADIQQGEPSVNIASGVVISELQTGGAIGASSELIELYNATPQDIDITGWCIQYASSTGANYTNRFCFTPNGEGAGLRVILSANSYAVLATDQFIFSNDKFTPDGRLSGAMADSGGRIRVVNELGGVVDLLGWGTADKYEGQAALAIPGSLPARSLQRVTKDGQYQDTDNNLSDFILAPVKTLYQSGAIYEAVDLCSNISGLQLEVDASLWRLKNGQCVDRSSINLCEGLLVSEIAANTARQYVELVNISTASVYLGGCSVATNRSQSIRFILPDILLNPGGFVVVYVDETELKLTKSTTGAVYLIASDGETEIDSVYYEDLSTETSWSSFPGGWMQTYELTPGSTNVYVKYLPCQYGYYRNEGSGRCNKITEPLAQMDCGEGRERNSVTGRCRNIPSVSQLTPCREGQYRSEETNRCRSIASAASALKPCADDQFRNPETNRCKKIASVEELADCGEGRERNPDTNRCRNVLASATIGDVPFAPEQVTQTAQGMTHWWAIGGLSLLALAYAGWQWRFEVSRLTGRIAQAFSSKTKG